MRIRRTLPTVALASSLLVGGFSLPQTADAQQIHLSFGDSDPYYDQYGYGYEQRGGSNLAGDLLGAFLTGVVNHFGRSEQDVYLIQSRGIHERELPVVFYLARQAGVSPMAIANLRASGYSWSDITYRLGMSSDIYYVPLNGYYGQYSSYYQVPRSRWSTLRLSDDAVIGLVNTRFISDYYRTPADSVLRLRSSGRDFTVMARDFYRPERHGQLRTWRRQVAQQREAVQRRDQRLDRREAALQQQATQQRRVTQQRRERLDDRRENVQRREAVQGRELRQRREAQQQQQRMDQRQETNRQAVQRREARQQREQQVQERRQERRQTRADRPQGKRNRKDKD